MRRIRPDQWPLIAAMTALAVSGGALLYYLMVQQPKRTPSAEPAPPPGPKPPVSLSPLAPEPRWEWLERFGDTHTAAEFRTAMQRVYGDGSPAWEALMTLSDDVAAPPRVQIARWSAAPATTRLVLGLSGTRPVPRYWREAAEMPSSSDPANRPLEGVKIALDPGHIGGAWAKMEQRWYQPPDEDTAVMEGEMTLRTARLLQPVLEALGARVSMVRDSTDPVTATRPDDFAVQAATAAQAELFFYRKAEIRARADKVNQQLQPDLVVCLHFNAEPWGEPGKVTFVEANHLHVIVNG
ncbi:MAG: N-acetylmuramoyl-L-alanine amidase, partial [Verrucomicrobiales bacterium]